jgi:hypothetical protein
VLQSFWCGVDAAVANNRLMLAVRCHRRATRIAHGHTGQVNAAAVDILLSKLTLSNMQAGQTPIFVMSTLCGITMNRDHRC